MGRPSLLLVFWDPANDQFIFLADTEVVNVPYTESDTGVPAADFPNNVLRVRNSVENCATGAPRSTTGFVTYDDVIIGVTVP